MNGLLEAARELQLFCDRNGWHFCFIGGIAVQRWGEPHDAEGVVIRHKDAIDWNYIESQLRPLAEVKGDPEILRTLVGLCQL